MDLSGNFRQLFQDCIRRVDGIVPVQPGKARKNEWDLQNPINKNRVYLGVEP